jgi:hypothetical protein
MTRRAAIGTRTTLAPQEDHGDDRANVLAAAQAEATLV